LLSDRDVGLSGFPLPLRASSFLPSPCGIHLPVTVPLETCASRVHPPVSFAPLQSTAVLPSASDPRAQSAFLGVCIRPHRDISHPHRHGEFPTSPPLRPRRFSRPRRFDPRIALWVYFTPQPRPGFTLQGFSLRCSRITSSVTRALSSLSAVCCWQLPTSATFHRFALRAFIHTGVRCQRLGS